MASGLYYMVRGECTHNAHLHAPGFKLLGYSFGIMSHSTSARRDAGIYWGSGVIYSRPLTCYGNSKHVFALTSPLLHRAACTPTTDRRNHQSCGRPSRPSRGTAGCQGHICWFWNRETVILIFKDLCLIKVAETGEIVTFKPANLLQSVKVRVEVFYWDILCINSIPTCGQQTWREIMLKVRKEHCTQMTTKMTSQIRENFVLMRVK